MCTLTIADDDPLSARVENRATVEFGRADNLNVKIEVTNVVHADESTFYINSSLHAFDGDELVHTQTWTETVPRDRV